MRASRTFVARVGLVALALAALEAAEPTKKKKRGSDGRMDLASELPPDASRLALGDAAPDFRLPGVDGRTYTPDDFRASRLLLVGFLSNHCP